MNRWPTRDGREPEIIAHRGASGHRPEHTLAAYELGLEQGADVIEPDLVPSRDGVLFCRHDPGLARSTDVARRAAWAARRVDGDWPVHRFDAVEIDALGAIQPFPGRSPRHDGEQPPLRFEAAIAWAARAAAARGREVVLYPEIKHPLEFAAAGVDPLPSFEQAVARLPAGVAIRVQCFDAAPLRRIAEATGLPCTLLLAADADWRAALAGHGGWLAALGIDKQLLGEDGLLAAAHARGLRVDAWTFRDDRVAAGHRTIDDELCAALRSGADGLFCDFPDTALRVRAALSAGG
jgi:glycerophosphoryl diester phosphodiesterase